MQSGNATNVSSKYSGSFNPSGVILSDSGIHVDNWKCRSSCNIISMACTNVITGPCEMAGNFPTIYYTLFPDNEVRYASQIGQFLLGPISNQKQILPNDLFNLSSHNLSKQNILSVQDAFSQTVRSNQKCALLGNRKCKKILLGCNHTLNWAKREIKLGKVQQHSTLVTHCFFALFYKSDFLLHFFRLFRSAAARQRRPFFSHHLCSAKTIEKKTIANRAYLHIDVYCTGSDADEDRCSSSCSNSIDEPNIVELESNSTPQTVYDADQLKLHNTRVAGTGNLPRRIVASNQHDYMQSTSYCNLHDYLLLQCDSRDEVTGSKQMLFEKHVGGMNDVRNNQSALRSTRWLKSAFRATTEKRKALAPGYSCDHLLRAQKFGSVIEAIRKSGHYVGPAKNPDCKCEYCRRWFAEHGDNFLERASERQIAVTNAFINRISRTMLSSFWQRFHLLDVV